MYLIGPGLLFPGLQIVVSVIVMAFIEKLKATGKSFSTVSSSHLETLRPSLARWSVRRISSPSPVPGWYSPPGAVPSISPVRRNFLEATRPSAILRLVLLTPENISSSSQIFQTKISYKGRSTASSRFTFCCYRS